VILNKFNPFHQLGYNPANVTVGNVGVIGSTLYNRNMNRVHTTPPRSTISVFGHTFIGFEAPKFEPQSLLRINPKTLKKPSIDQINISVERSRKNEFAYLCNINGLEPAPQSSRIIRKNFFI